MFLLPPVSQPSILTLTTRDSPSSARRRRFQNTFSQAFRACVSNCPAEIFTRHLEPTNNMTRPTADIFAELEDEIGKGCLVDEQPTCWGAPDDDDDDEDDEDAELAGQPPSPT